IGSGAEEILIPEEDEGIERLIQSLQRSRRSGKTSSIIIDAEGDKSGKNIFELTEYIGETLEDYDIRVSVLGHIQRGGATSCFDRVLGSKLGVGAVDDILRGEKNIIVGIYNQKVITVSLKTGIKGENKF